MKTYLSGKEPRCVESFNLDWYFYHGEKEQIPGESHVEAFEKVRLPHDWSLFYPFDEHAPSCGSGGYVETGVGWYRKWFRLAKTPAADERIYLKFEGVYMLADVWINGRKAGRHIYGYTPFEWDITRLLHGEERDNVIDVRVDNSAQPGSRWYSGSGITRDVWLYRVKEVHILPYGVWIRQLDVNEKRAKLRIETTCSAGADLLETEIYSPQGLLCAKDGMKVSPGNGQTDTAGNVRKDSAAAEVFCQEFELVDPMLWTLQEPCLYEVVTKLYRGDRLTDEVHTRTGLRSAVFQAEKGFLLNGKQCKLKGVCLHHDGGCAGAAVPVEVWERRLLKLKAMGANAIRTAHNPPDPALLTLCDTMGFLVMDEAFDEWKILKGKEFGSNTHGSRGYSEWYETCHEEDLRTMLLRDRNHPCIVIWSIGNEVPDQQQEDGYLTARHLKEICKTYDPERPVTQANDQISAEPYPAKTAFLNELDVVGYNYVGRWRNRAETFYDEDRRAYPDWCILGTENSGTGGIRGEYPLEMSEKEGWWRRPYYSAPVESGKLLRYTMSHDYVAGDFMWTGVDYLGEAHWPERSSSAGVLDTCGFEKDGYYFYRSIWNRDTPMAHLLPHWNQEVEAGTVLPVLCYTNCDCVELFLNGKSYGKKAYVYPCYGMTEAYGHFEKPPTAVNTGDLFLSWDVPYEPGCMEAVGYCGKEEVVRDVIRTAGEPKEIRASCDRDSLAADGRSVAQIEIAIFDAAGNFCPQADDSILLEVEGPADLIGVDNGNPRSHESMKGNRISAFHGRAFALIRSSCGTGDCLIHVTAKGLSADSLKIRFR